MIQRRAHLDIQVLKREAQRLVLTDASWTTIDPEDRVAFRAEWHDLMDIFGHVAAACEAGRLDQVEAQDLRSVASILATALPVMDRLRLRRPDPGVLARMRLAAAS